MENIRSNRGQHSVLKPAFTGLPLTVGDLQWKALYIACFGVGGTKKLREKVFGGHIHNEEDMEELVYHQE